MSGLGRPVAAAALAAAVLGVSPSGWKEARASRANGRRAAAVVAYTWRGRSASPTWRRFAWPVAQGGGRPDVGRRIDGCDARLRRRGEKAVRARRANEAEFGGDEDHVRLYGRDECRGADRRKRPRSMADVSYILSARVSYVLHRGRRAVEGRLKSAAAGRYLIRNVRELLGRRR